MKKYRELREIARALPEATSRVYHFREDIEIINKTNMDSFDGYPTTKRSLKVICAALESGKIISLIQLDKHGKSLIDERTLYYLTNSADLTNLNYLEELIKKYGEKLQCYRLKDDYHYDLYFELKKDNA